MSWNLGLLVNTSKPSAIKMARRLIKWGKNKGIEFILPPHEASILGIPGVEDQKWKELIDLSIVIGGDGTMLRAARYVMGGPVALYGFNVGHLGFLASGNPDRAEEEIEQILEGERTIEKRDVLEGRVIRGDLQKYTMYALNDFALCKGAVARVINIEVSVGEHLFAQLPADGIVVSSPTGSTAYSLSAGGPIVPPHVPCMILTTICAHTLYSRPVIFGEHDRITLSPRGEHRDLLLSHDGQLHYEILPSDRIEISLSKEKGVKIVTLPDRDYYTLLQEKLKWGQGFKTVDGE